MDWTMAISPSGSDPQWAHPRDAVPDEVNDKRGIVWYHYTRTSSPI